MFKIRKAARVMLCVLIILSMVITNDENIVNAIQQNSYSYMSQDLKRPDLVTSAEAKARKHIRRVPEKEDEYTFVFENMDGTLTSYTYGTKVQVRDGSSLQEIDLDVSETKDKAGKVTGYKQTGNGYKTQFPAELSEDSGISLAAGDSRITMTPLRNGRTKASAAQAVPGKVKDYTGKVTYRDVFGEGADLELCTTLTGIKEDIVLKKAPASNVFLFLITAPGLDTVVTDSGAVEFYDSKTLALKYRIPETYAKDSFKGAMLEGDGHYTEDIKVSLTAAGTGKWLYRLELSEEFLFGENTVYPVRIDPTLSVTSVSYHKDAYINSANPDTNYYLNTFMCVGRDSTLLKCRTYVKVMLNQLYATDALAVSKAEYYITETAGYTSDCNIRLYRIETSWSSNTIIWNNRPGIDSTVIDNQFVNGAGTYKYNITALVNGWYLDSEGAEGGYANNGFLLMSDREDSLVYRRFASSDASVDPPYLVITYTNVDRTAPNPPTNLTTSYIKEPSSNGTAQLKLNWTAAADLPSPGAAGIKNYELVIKNSSGTTVYTNNNVLATATSFTTTGYYPDIETYTFYLKAVDKAKEVDGTAIYNKSANATASRYVPDCKKPVINSAALTPASSATNPTNATSMTLNWTIADDSSLSKLEYWVNTYAVTTVTNPAKTGSLTASTAPLGTGSYTLYVKATDTSGNVSATTGIGFTIDRTQPEASSAFTGNLVGSTFILPMSFVDNYVLSQAIAEYGAGTSPASYTQLAAETLTGTSDTWSPQISTSGWTAAQYYTIRVRVKDKAGNWNNTFTRTVIKNGASVTVPAALVMDPIPATITTPIVQINHNRRTTRTSDVFINGIHKGAFSPNAAISAAVNRPEYPEGSAIDLIVRAYDPVAGTAEYNASLERSTYIHDMSTTSGLTLTNTVIDTAAGVLKLASGYTTGSAILSVPFPEAGARIDSVCPDALAQLPSGSTLSYTVYDPLTQTWRSLSIGTWLYFSGFVDFNGYTGGMRIKITLTGSTSPQLSLLKITYNDLGMAPAKQIKLLPDVTGIQAAATGTNSIGLSWNACAQVAGISPVYNVYRGETSGFTANANSRIFTGLTAVMAADTKREAEKTYYYKVIPCYPALNYNGTVYSVRTGTTSVQPVSAVIPDLSLDYAASGRQSLRQDAGIEAADGDAFTDLKTGNFNYRTTDLTLPGWQIDMEISRSYNSTLTQSGIIGCAWHTGLTQELSEYYTGDPAVLERVTYIDHFGTLWEFDTPETTAGLTTFAAMPGCTYALTKENGLYTINDGAGLLYRFDQSLKLYKIETEEKPFIQENPDETNVGVGSVTVSDTFGAVDWTFDAVKNGSGEITGFDPQDSACPFTLAYALDTYVLSETAAPAKIYTFEINDTQVHDETLMLLSDPAQGWLVCYKIEIP